MRPSFPEGIESVTDSIGDRTVATFSELDLSEPVQAALSDMGYEAPTPIQSMTIPHLLEGRDLVGQAQTGTGKTAAFALPLLSRLDTSLRAPQVLVLTPTRELAIQVSKAFDQHAAKMSGVRVLSVYGGAGYGDQLHGLRRGVHVVVGTPGRVMDHMNRGTLKLDSLAALVLDEADEMLHMGFIDDVEWVLERTPASRQIALFSATMPPAIRRIARRYLNEPEELSIHTRTTAAETIRQRYVVVRNCDKLEALRRILEAETTDGVLIFVRTRNGSAELAERLEARGQVRCCALNGDMAQSHRERVVESFRRGHLDILVATDVAARGLDVDRISHVINYDPPADAEGYVHRIGRTGRAGRTGEAILLISPRERQLPAAFGRVLRQRIEPMQVPSAQVINKARIKGFHDKITATVEAGSLDFYEELINSYLAEHQVPPEQVAAALARLAQGDQPVLLEGDIFEPKERSRSRERGRKPHPGRAPTVGLERYRIEVGHQHEVKPGNIVGAIANEAGLEGRSIGRLDIYGDHSTIELPAGMPTQIFKRLQKVRVCQQQLRISKMFGHRSKGRKIPKSRKGSQRHKP